MPLANEVKQIVSQFEFSDSELNRNVTEFLKQMGSF